MKRTSIAVALAVLGLMIASAHGQASIPWFTIDGGGGASAGGAFSLRGSIGQPDAGEATAGEFKLTGGYWALGPSVHSGNRPMLFITRGAPGFVVLSWLPAADDFVLQAANVLASTAWTNVSSATNGMSIPASASASFYRLQKP